MTINIVPPASLPAPPKEYDQRYFADLIRALEAFIDQERNPGEQRGTKMTLTDLPTSSTDLEVGALFRDGDNVKIKT